MFLQAACRRSFLFLSKLCNIEVKNQPKWRKTNKVLFTYNWVSILLKNLLISFNIFYLIFSYCISNSEKDQNNSVLRPTKQRFFNDDWLFPEIKNLIYLSVVKTLTALCDGPTWKGFQKIKIMQILFTSEWAYHSLICLQFFIFEIFFWIFDR